MLRKTRRDAAKTKPAGLKTARRMFAPTEFHFFNRLPTELRLQIWEAYAGIPRTIRIDVGEAAADDAEAAGRPLLIDGKPTEQTCVLLRVTHESRRVALKNLHHFSVSYDVGPPRDRVRSFAYRPWDVVYFSGRPSFDAVRVSGDSSRAANILVEDHVHNFQSSGGLDAIMEFVDAFAGPAALVSGILRNHAALEKVYCLLHSSTADESAPFEPHGLCAFTPARFPAYRRRLETWYNAFKAEVAKTPPTVRMYINGTVHDHPIDANKHVIVTRKAMH